MNYDVVVINLPHRSDRKEHVKNQLHKHSICHTFYEAVNGKNIDIDNLDNFIITNKGKTYAKGVGKKKWGLTLTPGAVGCALSHLNLWNSVQTHKNLVIFEDDIILCDNFKSRLHELFKEVPDDWELLYLGSHIKPKLLQENSVPYFVPVGKQVNGTGSYVINKTGAEKLRRLCFPLNENQIDTVMYNKFKQLKVYHANPPLVTTHRFSSDVQ
jgi:GR25 family glycosyltransferase involved in LPS biosynthesis